MADDFESLPPALQQRVDAAFDAVLFSTSSIRLPPTKRRRLNTGMASEPASGFIVDDSTSGLVIEDNDNPGGFILPQEKDGEDSLPSPDDLIPFSLIPTALQILDLPPDDEEVLQVLRNAASGWSGIAGSGDGIEVNDNGGESRAVSRKDWRAVCAVVVGSREEDDEPEDDAAGQIHIVEGRAMSSDAEPSMREGSDEEGDEDAYENSSLSAFSDEEGSHSDSDDEYTASPSRSRSKSKARNSRRTQRAFPAPGVPTPRQERAAVEAFALFFPSSPPLSQAELSKKCLMFTDIVKVAELLKEKIKAEEITEMLSLFSSIPDKSMSLDDFTRMMVMAKLV